MFVPASNADKRLVSDLRAALNGDPTNYPSPYEISMLSGENHKLGEQIMGGLEWRAVKKLQP
jgi:hypothetical protein